MRVLKLAYVILILGVFTSTMWAQEETANQPTIEDVYLQSSVEVQVISSQASADTREMKLFALDGIRDMIERGAVSENSVDVINILKELSREGTTKEVRVQNRLVNNFPQIRMRSARLLGEVGGPIARRNLIQIVRHDNEPIVLSEAIYSLGLIGLDDEGEALETITGAIRNQNAIRPDDNLAFSTLLAFEKIAERNNGLNNPDVFEIIIMFAQGNYIRDVKLKAVQLLDKLRKYN